MTSHVRHGSHDILAWVVQACFIYEFPMPRSSRPEFIDLQDFKYFKQFMSVQIFETCPNSTSLVPALLLNPILEGVKNDHIAMAMVAAITMVRHRHLTLSGF